MIYIFKANVLDKDKFIYILHDTYCKYSKHFKNKFVQIWAGGGGDEYADFY